MGGEPRITYVLIDGENIDATLGMLILGRRPRPEERPRWERLLQFAQELWEKIVVRALLPRRQQRAADAVRPSPDGDRLPTDPPSRVPGREGGRHRHPADAGRDPSSWRRTCSWSATTGTSSTRCGDLLDGRRVGVVGFQEFRSNAFLALKGAGSSTFDLEYEVQAFKEPLPVHPDHRDRRLRPGRLPLASAGEQRARRRRPRRRAWARSGTAPARGQRTTNGHACGHERDELVGLLEERPVA